MEKIILYYDLGNRTEQYHKKVKHGQFTKFKTLNFYRYHPPLTIYTKMVLTTIQGKSLYNESALLYNSKIN